MTFRHYRVNLILFFFLQVNGKPATLTPVLCQVLHNNCNDKNAANTVVQMKIQNVCMCLCVCVCVFDKSTCIARVIMMLCI